jgi:phage terminase large subunit-like protein
VTVTVEAPWMRYAAGSEIDHFAAFCAEHLTQSIDQWDGLPLVLEPFQLRMMGEALAYDNDGWPVWRSIVIVLPRKNGKTQLLAAYAVYRLLTSDGSPEILLAASSGEQADRLFEAAMKFVQRSETLSELCIVRDYTGEILRHDGMGVIKRLASDAKRLHGYNPSLVVCDELAQWTTPGLRKAFAALTSGGAARSAPQTFTITTAGEAADRHDSILGRLLDAAHEAPDVETEPGLLIGRDDRARMLVYNYEAPTTDPRDVAAMKLANPAPWVTEEFLATQAENPELTHADVLQLHGCVWAAKNTTWIAPDAWKACVVPTRDIPAGEKVVLGFDGSERRDATVLSVCTLDGYVKPLRVWQKPQGSPDDWRIPRPEVHTSIDAAFEKWQVLELACDPPGWYSEIEEWRSRHGDEAVVEFDTRQPKRFAPACERFAADTLEHRLKHDGDPVLAAHVGHAIATDSPYGVLIRKDHDDSPRKIDAAVSAVIAYERAAWHAQHTKTAREILVAFA